MQLNAGPINGAPINTAYDTTRFVSLTLAQQADAVLSAVAVAIEATSISAQGGETTTADGAVSIAALLDALQAAEFVGATGTVGVVAAIIQQFSNTLLANATSPLNPHPEVHALSAHSVGSALAAHSDAAQEITVH